jgi:hypothetical protein
MSIVCSTVFIHVLKSLGDGSMRLKLSELMDSQTFMVPGDEVWNYFVDYQ